MVNVKVNIRTVAIQVFPWDTVMPVVDAPIRQPIAPVGAVSKVAISIKTFPPFYRFIFF
jgi:hypothetical protein